MDAMSAVKALNRTISAAVGDPAAPDLSQRQLAILLTCYLEGAQTVRGLAQKLNISKPAITRGIDRLEQLGYARRKPDSVDRRSVYVLVQQRGSSMAQGLGVRLVEAISLFAGELPKDEKRAA